MKRINLIILCVLLMSCASTIFSQELKKEKKKKGEITQEFYVLKDNKEIKHGQFLSTLLDGIDNKFIIEYGQYDKNVKSGVWMDFYYKNLGNFLKSIGTYVDDKKESDWVYYFPGRQEKFNIYSLTGADIRTKVVKQKKDVQGFQIELDTTGMRIMCSGKYMAGNKVDIWNYYSQSGFLIQKYDHSSKKMVVNRIQENDFLNFLGGEERFYNYYSTAQEEIKMSNPITETSEVKFEIEKNGNYKFISLYGNGKFQNYVEEILKSIPNDWINMDPKSTKKLILISKVIFNENSFKRYEFSLNIQVVNS